MSRTPNIQLIDRLREEFRNGAFEDNAMLPPERTLAQQFGVGRTALRAALAVLQREGIVQTYPHRGTRLTAAAGNSARLKRVLVRYESHLSRTVYEIIELLSGISIAASKRNIEVILSLSPDRSRDRELIGRYRSGAFDGMIFIDNTIEPELEKMLLDAGVPYVTANDESGRDHPHVSVDFRAVGRLAGQRLLRTPFRRPAVLTGPLRMFIFKEMLAGFRGALAEEEVYLDRTHISEISAQPGPDETYPELRKMLTERRRPDAFFVMRDCRAEPLFRLCAEYGLRIPEDVEIIAYDDLSWPEGAKRGLTTISQPVESIGSAALDMLAEWKRRKACPPSMTVCGELVERTTLRAGRAR